MATASKDSKKLSKDAPASYTPSVDMSTTESASSTPKTPNNPDGPTVEDDRKALEAQLVPDTGRREDVDVNPAEVAENDADWAAGRELTDVVEVEGQRETVESRLARNGYAKPNTDN